MSIAVIAFSNDVCDCEKFELVEVWFVGSDGGSVWVVGGVMSWVDWGGI